MEGISQQKRGLAVITVRPLFLLSKLSEVSNEQYFTCLKTLGAERQRGLKIAVAESFDEPVKLYERQTALQPPAPADDGKHWVDATTYIGEDGVVHNLDEETDDEPPFDISAFDPEALALLDELLGEQIEMR